MNILDACSKRTGPNIRQGIPGTWATLADNVSKHCFRAAARNQELAISSAHFVYVPLAKRGVFPVWTSWNLKLHQTKLVRLSESDSNSFT